MRGMPFLEVMEIYNVQSLNLEEENFEHVVESKKINKKMNL